MVIRNTRERWGSLSQFLHWLIVALIALQATLGLTGMLLPLGVSREGAVRPVSFPCTVTFGGRTNRGGVSVHVFSLRGSAPKSPSDICDDMNRSDVTIRGALLYDTATGLLAEAHVTAAVSAWLERGRVEDLVRLNGAWDVRKR